MKRWLSKMLLCACACLSTASAAFAASMDAPLQIVAAENFYADVVRQIGSEQVSVTSILSNPDQDPHLFEASPSTARALARARLVVYNGAGYDPWMAKLLGASPAPQRSVLIAADLVGKRAGDNPHLWYLPATMPAVARAVAQWLGTADPAHRTDYQRRLAAFEASLQPLDAQIAALRARYAGVPVTATEPVFGYMADALGLQMRNQRFQLAVMNGAEPAASDVAAFERDLRERRVHALLYNAQTSDAMTQKLRALAQQSRVPVVAITETEPAGASYQQWMLAQLNALDQALAGAAR